jgi:hypothetical protein
MNSPGGIDIRAVLNEQSDNKIVAARTSGVERKDAVENRVDRLAMRESVLDETDVSCRSSNVQAKMRD